MIKKISIKNFKTVVNLDMDFDRFNILIGENGCGKSNILEGIALGGAAAVDKLDREFFANRGIRVCDPRFMYSAFEQSESEYIEISFTSKNGFDSTFKIYYNQDTKPPRWEEKVEKNTVTFMADIQSIIDRKGTLTVKDVMDVLNETYLDSDSSLNINLKKEAGTLYLIRELNEDLSRFIIYSPEESKLRDFDNSNKTYPLGKNGEGLFAYLKELAQKPDGIKILDEIKTNLDILDWFDDLKIPERQLSNEFTLRIKDRYVDDTLDLFDQRSTNEGFLYLLFYLTLFISDETPSFFAIDNIEASFNPKLCREIIHRLVILAQKHNKQAIVTTHNPSILDGIDIAKDDERLYVVRRDIDGHTIANRIEYKSVQAAIPLSEAWLKGYIGGLPDSF